MTALVKLGIGAAVTGIGLFITFSAERQLIAERECVDCDDEVTESPMENIVDEVVTEDVDHD